MCGSHDLQGREGLAERAPGELVAIFGVGGLGHLALQYAVRSRGGTVVAVDVLDEKLELHDAGATPP